jgi:hypothetical protein
MKRALFPLLALASLLPATVGASIARAIPFDQKVADADSIVLGRCVGTRAEWDPSHRWIITYSTFQVEKTLKGNPAQQLTVATPGGHVGEVYQDSIGVPKFAEGQEHVVFVTHGKVGSSVLYFDQGAYAVDREGGEAKVKGVMTNAVYVDTQTGKAVAPDSALRTLPEFEAAVRNAKLHPFYSQNGLAPKPVKPATQSTSLKELIMGHKLLLAIVAIGLALASWQLWRR